MAENSSGENFKEEKEKRKEEDKMKKQRRTLKKIFLTAMTLNNLAKIVPLAILNFPFSVLDRSTL